MPSVSRRISKLDPSPTIALNSKAKELKKQGHKVLNFAVGEPDFCTPESIKQAAIQAIQADKTKYGPAGGSLELREAICKKLKRENGLDYDPSLVVCGIGAKEILLHTFLALLNEGDEVLLPAPFWVSYQDQIKAAGGVPVVVPMPDSIFSGQPIDLDILASYSSDKTKAIVLNAPNNPAGYVWEPSFMEKLQNFLEERPDWWVISDEIYEYMSFDRSHTSIANCTSLKERLILINGLSKGFAMTGWRVGFGVGPKVAMDLVRSLQSHSSTCLPPFIEEAAMEAIHSGFTLVEPEIKRIQSSRDRAVKKLDSLRVPLNGEAQKIRYIRPAGAFYVFVDVRPYLNAATDSMTLSTWLLEHKRLAVVPGEAFGAPGFLRLSYAVPTKLLDEGLELLAEGLKEFSAAT